MGGQKKYCVACRTWTLPVSGSERIVFSKTGSRVLRSVCVRCKNPKSTFVGGNSGQKKNRGGQRGGNLEVQYLPENERDYGDDYFRKMYGEKKRDRILSLKYFDRWGRQGKILNNGRNEDFWSFARRKERARRQRGGVAVATVVSGAKQLKPVFEQGKKIYGLVGKYGDWREKKNKEWGAERARRFHAQHSAYERLGKGYVKPPKHRGSSWRIY